MLKRQAHERLAAAPKVNLTLRSSRLCASKNFCNQGECTNTSPDALRLARRGPDVIPYPINEACGIQVDPAGQLDSNSIASRHSP